jgi:polysaccharide export outer membrane protein
MKRMKLAVFAFLLWAVSAGAWAQAEKLGVGDAVRITVFGQPDLATEARVNERGTIAMPLAGEVKVAGLSPTEAGTQIAGELKKKQYLKNPQVQVAITALRSRQVSVLGQIARPGRYVLDDTSSQLADVIAAAGGGTAGGGEVVTVMRDGKEQRIDVLGKPYQLKAGDVVKVERGPVFYVYGEVTRSGTYALTPNMTVMQAIASGGGITPRGSDRRVKLRRAGADGKVVETDARLNDAVKSDDVIFVKEALF